MPPDTYATTVLAAEHCSFYSEAPSEAKALFTQQLYRSHNLLKGRRLAYPRVLCGSI